MKVVGGFMKVVVGGFMKFLESFDRKKVGCREKVRN